METFTDSASAMARIEEKGFDIVITDLKMEGTDGMRFLARVKEIAPDTGVIVITGFATPESAKESFRKGAYRFCGQAVQIERYRRYRPETGRKTSRRGRTVAASKRLRAIHRSTLCPIGTPETMKRRVGWAKR